MSVLKFKEPSISTSNELTTLQLINLLNTYYLHPDNTLETLKDYLNEYLIRFNKQYLNIKVSKISSYSPYLIIARLLVIGWTLSDKHIVKFDAYLNSLSIKHSKILEDSSASIKTIVKKEETFEHYNNLDLYIDSKFTNVPYQYTVETQVLKIKSCIEYIDKQIELYQLDIKERVIDKVKGKLVIDALTSLRDEYNKSKVSSKPSSSKRAKNKNVMVKSVKYQMKLLGSLDKYYIPLNAVGKKKMYVYDESKKILSCFFSTTGFTFTGTTLKDFTDKSVCVKIKDEKLLSNSLSSLNELLTSNAKIVKPITHGRFNENMIIIALS